MGEAGVLGSGSDGVEGSAGWRRRTTTSRGGMPGAASPSSCGASGVAGACGVGVLQLLSRDQANLVPILGKSTGWDSDAGAAGGGTDKRGKCAAVGNEWSTIDGRWVTGERRFRHRPRRHSEFIALVHESIFPIVVSQRLPPPLRYIIQRAPVVAMGGRVWTFCRIASHTCR